MDMRHGRGVFWDERGALSLEAAIALPVFVCVVVAFGFLLRCVQVHERVQHAISQAALEIACMSYAYDRAGMLDIQREADAAADRALGKAADTVQKSARFDNWLPREASAETGDILDSAADALKDRVNGALFSPLARLVTRKYLAAGTEGSSGAREALRGVNLIGGDAGLDFIESTYLADGGDDVNISVNYRFRIPIFIRPLSVIGLSQSAVARAWLYEAGSYDAGPDESLFEEDIWSLGNFERGRKLRTLFHANLPAHFPGLSAYADGTATLIRSLDTTAASYATPEGIGGQIDGYVRAIRDYAGQERPFGREGIIIPPGDIATRRLVLVIPRNELTPQINAEIDRCIRDALAQGVVLQVERYGKKQVAEPEDQ